MNEHEPFFSSIVLRCLLVYYRPEKITREVQLEDRCRKFLFGGVEKEVTQIDEKLDRKRLHFEKCLR